MKRPLGIKGMLKAIAVFLLVLLAGYAYSSQNSVMQTIKAATAPSQAENLIEAVLLPSRGIVQATVPYQGGLFWTETRKDKMERFKCSQCHIDRATPKVQSAAIAHGDIVLDHGEQGKPLACFTCHNKGERNYLVSEKGLKVDMDHSYQLCGQCHFRQKADWVGGAHGKRIKNWAGQRMVVNCTSCHDPHAPRFEKRWPKTYSPPIKK